MKRVWLPSHVLDEITREAERKAPLETGGVLAGYCSEDDNDIVVTHMVGPGPKAIHRRWTFCPDYDFDHDQILKIFTESEGTITYLGDWHTHPAAKPYLSRLDKSALLNIAKSQSSYIERPIMLVLGGEDEKSKMNWVPVVWRIFRSKRFFLATGYDYTTLEIARY